MQRTLKLMVVCRALSAGACASDDDGGKPSPAPVDAPDPGVMDTESGWVFRTEEFTLGPGEERFVCYAADTA